MKLSNLLKLLGFAFIGGLCAFALDFLFSIFIPQEQSTSVVIGLIPSFIAILGAVAAMLFLKAPKRIPVALFFVGFLFLSKIFDGIVAIVFSQ